MFIHYYFYYNLNFNSFILGQKIQLFLAFSFYTNGKKLLSYEKAKSDDTLHCLHGIRVITTQWIVLGHSYLLYALLPIQNLAAIPEVSDGNSTDSFKVKLIDVCDLQLIEKYRSMLILSAPIAVDTFFVISGLLVSINMLKHLQQKLDKNDRLLHVKMVNTNTLL